MRKNQIKNKISQMAYRPKPPENEPKSALDNLEKLDGEIEEAFNSLFNLKKRKR